MLAPFAPASSFSALPAPALFPAAPALPLPRGLALVAYGGGAALLLSPPPLLHALTLSLPPPALQACALAALEAALAADPGGDDGVAPPIPLSAIEVVRAGTVDFASHLLVVEPPAALPTGAHANFFARGWLFGDGAAAAAANQRPFVGVFGCSSGGTLGFFAGAGDFLGAGPTVPFLSYPLDPHSPSLGGAGALAPVDAHVHRDVLATDDVAMHLAAERADLVARGVAPAVAEAQVAALGAALREAEDGGLAIGSDMARVAISTPTLCDASLAWVVFADLQAAGPRPRLLCTLLLLVSCGSSLAARLRSVFSPVRDVLAAGGAASWPSLAELLRAEPGVAALFA